MTERTALYRFYDGDSRLLYIGITKSFGERWAKHAESKPWYEQVRHQTVTWFDTRQAAENAETMAIRAERPLHNVNKSPWRIEVSADGNVEMTLKPVVADGHKVKPKAFRPEPDEYDDGMTVLGEHDGWGMDGFLRACLRMLVAEPDRLLGLLAPYRPPPKRRGRPPKQD